MVAPQGKDPVAAERWLINMNRSRILLVALIAALLFLFWASGGAELLTLERLQAERTALLNYRDANPLFSSALFFTLYVAVTALSIPGAAIMTLAGGAIFGLVWGVVLISFASTLGATLAMLLARYLASDWVRQRFGSRFKQLDSGIEREGPFYLFSLRLIPAVPFFLINVVMGLTKIRIATYWWVSQLGMLPATIVYVNAGTELAQISQLSDILSPSLLGAFVLLGLFPWIARIVLAWSRRRQLARQWQKPTQFDNNLLVIGAGSGGLVSAYIAAATKAKVTLIERHQMGGDCLNTGCVPSKALLRCARQAKTITQSGRFGITVAEPQIDFAAVKRYVQNAISRIEPHDSVERYTGLGVDVIQGSARLITPWEVEVTKNDGSSERISSRSIVIATGARPRVPELPGIEHVDALTSDTIWGLEALPKRLLVIGGGPIGCELAQAFARLGSQVILVQRQAGLLPREDQDVQALVQAALLDDGVELHLATQALSFENRDGSKLLLAESAAGEIEIPFDEVLMALGRQPNTENLGLEALGISLDAQQRPILDAYQASPLSHIYFCGDVMSDYQFTHVASHQAWYASVNGLLDGLWRFKTDYRVIPWATFTDPEVARVGLSETDAKAQGIAYDVSTYSLEELDRAIADDENHGFVKVLTVPGKDRILGVTIVGSHSAELIAEFVMAMKHNLGLNKVLGTIHIYPTYAEANKYVAGVWKRSQISARVMAWLAKFHRWRRS